MWWYYGYMIPIDSSKALWDTISIALISSGNFDVLCQKCIHYCLANIMDDDTSSGHTNTKEMWNGPVFYVGPQSSRCNRYSHFYWYCYMHCARKLWTSPQFRTQMLKCCSRNTNFLFHSKLLLDSVTLAKAWLLLLTQTDCSCSVLRKTPLAAIAARISRKSFVDHQKCPITSSVQEPSSCSWNNDFASISAKRVQSKWTK